MRVEGANDVEDDAESPGLDEEEGEDEQEEGEGEMSDEDGDRKPRHILA